MPAIKILRSTQMCSIIKSITAKIWIQWHCISKPMSQATLKNCLPEAISPYPMAPGWDKESTAVSIQLEKATIPSTLHWYRDKNNIVNFVGSEIYIMYKYISLSNKVFNLKSMGILHDVIGKYIDITYQYCACYLWQFTHKWHHWMPNTGRLYWLVWFLVIPTNFGSS